ncbi:sigma-70 family RNA polymerase sigma factor [Aquibacillus sp. 3ASR75-11]|uniref:Sigma-70 family RNA polymerase sigma factor n=1 Tax=Terrihalobacillus insolitus TaxID=2950438 RepID=A0A9X3WPL7_9BACI|nr:sigma-70 family RNA polymerase sigma factor [Terrihalobacillus insolitus]MDC3411833.1 sigma-70 family RNA polymerase sigma factor [Terrihalobacillus insolitus]MDC3423500.1 sigma-70 family RNA polymerase sigma factor [Terrihalobacillus insolitus]
MNKAIDKPFCEVAKQNERRIHYHIHKLGIFDPHQEYYQEGLYALWNAYCTYQPEKGSFSTYLNYSIRNRLIDLLRKNIRQIEKDTLVIDYQISNYESYAIDTLEDPLFWEEIKSLLTIKQWKWVYYHIILDLPIKAIAQKENTTVDAVKNWGREVRKKLGTNLIIEK